ncbi:MAG: ABC transporter permease [Candidatus Methanogaster sp.]|uniref:ABC transporter permease n=1 Tax=Candidatus Methanogaster sp. TaxID=3386292 RepID=A0AC61L042_9EURY|nr:MAG: ABC transporter permease [ANME-2 cluster archaeon]
MKFSDYFRFCYKGLVQRKTRSYLTIVGIVIGIMAIVGLISIGVGMQVYMDEQIGKMGINKIIIMPVPPGGALGGPSSASTYFTDRDVRAVENVRGVDANCYMVYRTSLITYKDIDATASVVGMVPSIAEDAYFDVQGYELESGRDLEDKDTHKITIGYWIAYKTFKVGDTYKEVKIGDKIEIKEQGFKVIGIMEEIGNRDDDMTIIMSIDDAERLFDVSNEYDFFFAKIKEGADPEDVADRIRDRLEDERDEEDFTVMTAAQLSETVGGILSAVSAVLIGIGAISLLVGGVGIMNTMYTSVVERTREIGVYKALGAENNTILMLFLVESGLIGVIGGLIGIVLGFGMALMVEIIGKEMGVGLLHAWISWELTAFALLFSFSIGVLAGFLPSRSASQMDPVDALRHE